MKKALALCKILLAIALIVPALAVLVSINYYRRKHNHNPIIGE